MKTTCVIIDDEPTAIQLLTGMLKLIPGVEVVETFTDPQAAILKVMDSNPDLIFLDISMPGLSGLEFIDSLKLARVQSEVVFVTGFDNYALEAIRREAFDYLLKPIKVDGLMKMIFRLREKQKRKVSPKDLPYGKIRFNTVQGFFMIELADIVYVKADGNYSTAFLKDGTNRVITLNLGHMEDRLTGFSFFRLDRSVIINLKSLVYINRKDHVCTLAYNGSTVGFPISRIRIKQLTELF